jgi:CxxC-x17-CxxC domain-containing protein
VEEKIMRWHETYGEEVENRSVKTGSRSQAAETFRPLTPTATAKGIPLVPKTPLAHPVPLSSRPESVNKGYAAICASCGQETTTVFEPDGVRPVYCRDCLSKKKEEKRLDLEKRQKAKGIERERLEQEQLASSAPAKITPSLSLGDLKNIAPVDFRGREIKTKTVLPESYSAFKKDYEEKDLNEGEDVIFTE